MYPVTFVRIKYNFSFGVLRKDSPSPDTIVDGCEGYESSSEVVGLGMSLKDSYTVGASFCYEVTIGFGYHHGYSSLRTGTSYWASEFYT